MREILFRGKRVDNGEWVYGMLCNVFKDGELELELAIQVSDVFEMFAYPVIPETVGQYTGLDDKNGVKIFEGDVLHDSGHMLNGVVEYYTECGGWWYWDKDRFGTSLEFDDFDELAVIGNIYDNPELMEVTE